MSKWKVLNEKDVSPSSWFPILLHTVELPDGTIVDDFFISPLGDVGMVLPITTGNKVVLVSQYKHGLGETVIELPAGFQQKDKSIEDSALAELEEETGIRAQADQLIPLGKISSIPTKCNLSTYGFLAKDLTFNSKQNLEITENIELLLLEPKQVIQMIKDGNIWIGDSVSFIMKAYLLFPDLFV